MIANNKVKAKRRRIKGSKPVEKLITVEELSQILQISRSTIYDWSSTGFVPHYKLPKGIRFKMSEIEKWLLARRKKGRKRYKIILNVI